MDPQDTPMPFTYDQLLLILLLIEKSELPEPEMTAAWDLHGLIRQYGICMG